MSLHGPALHFLSQGLARVEATVANMKAGGIGDENEELVTMKNVATSVRSTMALLENLEVLDAKAAEIRNRAEGGPSTS